MSGPAFVIVLVAIWLAIGLGLSLVLGRRGHDGFTWFVIGTLLGPLALFLALDAVQNGEPAAPLESTLPGVAPGTGIDVLVGADGSRGARAAVEEAVALFGTKLGRVDLVQVIPFDGVVAVEREAKESIAAEAARYARLRPGTEVVRGRPADVLAARALEGGYDVLVVGTRGAGRHLFGSTARELASTSPIPVLLFGAPQSRSAGAATSEPVVVDSQSRL
jgi:nucleotide-binding universal stress UspA family protein